MKRRLPPSSRVKKKKFWSLARYTLWARRVLAVKLLLFTLFLTR